MFKTRQPKAMEKLRGVTLGNGTVSKEFKGELDVLRYVSPGEQDRLLEAEADVALPSGFVRRVTPNYDTSGIRAEEPGD
jgi:hypothetical protein